MTDKHPSLSPYGMVWRTMVVGVIYTIFFMVTASLYRFAPEIATTTDVDATIVMISIFIAGMLPAPTVGLISTEMNLSHAQRIGVLFLILYLWGYLINAPEVLLFTTMPLPTQSILLVTNLIMYLVLAIMVGLLFIPTQIGAGLAKALKTYFGKRKGVDWLWRFTLAAVLYFPIYYSFGLIFSPMTLQYYNRPELGLGLVLPSVEVWIPVEIGRGLVYAISAVPLLAVIRMPKWKIGLWIGLILAIIGGVIPQVINVAWPVPLRLGHGVEVVCDSFAQGLMMAWLLWVKP